MQKEASAGRADGFMSVKNSFYVTTPIYYVNDRPHIGHAYTTVLADVLAGWRRLKGDPVFFLTGTDEHGQKVQQAAEAAGITPQEQCDRTVVRFRELWERLEIRHDDFIRTTEARHKQVVQAVLQDLYDRGEIYKADYEGWYCVGCERFLTEKELVEGNCPECGRPAAAITESNYFFRMSRYQEWLIDYIETHPRFIQPAFRANETLGFLKNRPLLDLCISRPKARLAWGIELPFDPDFVTYVWFDALINYISAIGYKSDEARFRERWPCSCHLIGKDILTTHTVYWPTMLKAMGLEMPETVFAHGWWLTGRTKMSKSLGNVVDPMRMMDRCGVDAFRYFLMAEMTLGQDASFTEEAFIRRYNADLANDLGNLTSRVLNMTARYCGGRIPEPPERGPEEAEVWDGVQAAVSAMTDAAERMRLDAGIGAVLNAIRGINRYLEIKGPWALAKNGDTAGTALTLYTAAEGLRVCAALLYPVMPGKMKELRSALGMEDAPPQLEQLRRFGVLKPGTPVAQPEPLFPRLETGDAAEPVKKSSSKKEQPMEQKIEESGLITFDQVMAVQLRTARILAAEPIEGADRLLKLQVDLGTERRQLVAGIAKHYAPETLPGKTVVVVANLKPARLRGVESQGMLLAASAGDALKLVTVEGDLPPGSVVK